MLFIFPAMILGYQVLTIGVAGAGNLANISVCLIWLGCMADFFTYNGFTSKGYSFGVLKCSNHGKKLVMNGVIIDQIRRFASILLIMIISIVIAKNMMPYELPSDYVLLGIVMVLLVYGANTLSLLLLRNISSFLSYSLAAGITTMIFGVVISVALYYRYEQAKTNLILWLAGAVLLAVLSTLAMFKYVSFNYDRNFREEL